MLRYQRYVLRPHHRTIGLSLPCSLTRPGHLCASLCAKRGPRLYTKNGQADRASLDGNLVDADFGVKLPMARFSAGILPPAEFLDHEFRSLNHAENLCFHRGT